MLIVFLPFLVVIILAFYVFLVERLVPYIPLFIVVCSFVSVLLALVIQHYLSSTSSYFLPNNHLCYTLFISFIYSASVEELSKMFLFFISCKSLHLTEKFGDISTSNNGQLKVNNSSPKILSILAILFASSFAAFENVGYSVYNPELLLFRLFSATLLHIFIAPIYIGLFKKKVMSSIILSIAIHGSYNFLINASKATFSFSFLLLIALQLKNIHTLFKHKY